MPKSRIIIALGALIALLPLLGFPRSWESFFQILAGLSIILLSVWASIDKRIALKHKAQQRVARKVSPEAPASPDVAPASETMPAGQRITDFYPKTGQPGRRLTDLKRAEPPDEEPLI